MPVLLARGTSQVRGRPTPVRLVQWSAEEIFAVDDQGLGVFRVRGSAQAGDRLRDWSVILKVLLDESTAPMNGWSLAVREPLAYDSGLLDSPPEALGAPRRLGHAQQGGHHHLWLEDLGADDVRWSLRGYAYAARQLGRFNGGLSRRAPASGCGVVESRLAALVACRRRGRDRRATTSPRTCWSGVSIRPIYPLS
jgi:hypothetical protein